VTFPVALPGTIIMPLHKTPAGSGTPLYLSYAGHYPLSEVNLCTKFRVLTLDSYGLRSIHCHCTDWLLVFSRLVAVIRPKS
jgi:hypothetical protein